MAYRFSSYSTSESFHKFIQLKDIYIGPEMHYALEHYGKEINGESWEYDAPLVMDAQLLPLNRIKSMLPAFTDSLGLPPIKVKERDDKYEIIDGRHRIVLSIIFGYTTIPALLI